MSAKGAKAAKITGAVKIDYGESGSLEIWYEIGDGAKARIDQVDGELNNAGSDYSRSIIMSRFLQNVDFGGVHVWWNFIDSESDGTMFHATFENLVGLPFNTLRHLFIEVYDDMRRELGLPID